MAPLLAVLALAAAPIHVERDVHYGRSKQQTLDAYVVPAARRAVVLIRGGGWHSGSKESVDATALRFAQNGWTAFSISYRLVPPAPWYGAKDDAPAAVPWGRAHAARFGFDPRRLAVFGTSAGGNPAALVATVGTGRQLVAAAAFWSGPMSEIVPLGQATEMARRLEHAGSPHRLIVYRGSRHAVEYEREAWQPTLRFLASGTQPDALPRGFRVFSHGPAGGEIWRGVIPGATRASMVYVPPGYSRARRYPAVYLLSGMPGSPWSYVNSLSLASVADTLIARGLAVPFVAVMPPAGPQRHYSGEWAGPGGGYLHQRLIPWVGSKLSVSRERTIAGLSAGGFGAVDIALRHPRLFRQVESWGGYFRPFRDGPFRLVSATDLAAHDPPRLVPANAPLLRSLDVHFFLSTGPGHGQITAAATPRFARLLRALGLPYRLELVPRKQGEWERQLVDGLRWAFESGVG